MTAGRIAAGIGLTLGIAALGLQFGLTLSRSMGEGRGLASTMIFFFSFFTILTNIGVALVWAAELLETRWLRFFRVPVHRAALAAAIFFVMVFYHLMLAKIWAPQGFWKLADFLLHYFLPIIYLLWWWRYVPHRQLFGRDIWRMLAYPVLYVIWAMTRGAVTGEYPYPVLEVPELGYAGVIVNIVVLFVVFSVVCGGVLVADALLPRRRAE